SAEASRLLAAPAARETMRAFFAELFRLQRLDRLAESKGKYPQVTATLPASMRGETMRLFEEVAFGEGRDFREIFDARHTYVNRELARLYQLPEPTGGDDEY